MRSRHECGRGNAECGILISHGLTQTHTNKFKKISCVTGCVTGGRYPVCIKLQSEKDGAYLSSKAKGANDG